MKSSSLFCWTLLLKNKGSLLVCDGISSGMLKINIVFTKFLGSDAKTPTEEQAFFASFGSHGLGR